ncbi:MAG: outer membrane lipid asymmetry maintenance protein MlaD [Azoarcus sp.]|jgi:phospholipid/cholesterol/gamma-HCH transport system substrate-binding protein|nr:outer membrane lipid asymmetry maintenance protein MlaD [Azoarcus sp.]
MSRTILDLWVGVFVALGFAALVFLAMKVGGSSELSGAATYAVTAPFGNVGGLKPRAPVKSAGVVVGRVGGIHFDSQNFRAIVSIDLDERYNFPRDTSASILTSGLLGEQYIGLDPGADNETLKEGDTLEITQSAVVLEKLIGQFMFNKAAEAPPQP